MSSIVLVHGAWSDASVWERYGFTQTSPGMADGALGPALRPGEGVLGTDPDQFIATFGADLPDDLARQALSSLRPEPLRRSARRSP